MAKKNLTYLMEEAFAQYLPQYELVDVEFLKENDQWILRISIDKPDGIQLADCEKVSRVLGDYLDEKDPIERTYNLEVASPGIERPLKKAADYERFKGQEAAIYTYAALNGRKKFEGIIGVLAGEELHLQIDEETVKIPLEKIAKAHLLFRFEKV